MDIIELGHAGWEGDLYLIEGFTFRYYGFLTSNDIIGICRVIYAANGGDITRFPKYLVRGNIFKAGDITTYIFQPITNIFSWLVGYIRRK